MRLSLSSAELIKPMSKRIAPRIEAIIGDDFHFTSRATIASIAKCISTSAGKTATRSPFTFINLVADGERVFFTYEGQHSTGKPFRNTEIVTVRNGKVVEVEVYFGWSIPHEAPVGGFVDL